MVLSFGYSTNHRSDYIMNYHEAINYIHSFIPNKNTKWNKNRGLEKITYLLKRLGNPHHGQHFVHVGGTAGKGSTATMIASILQAAGYKTGLHVSPHTITVRERAQINGKNIDKRRFVSLVENIVPEIDVMLKEFGVPPSYFELLLAIAFHYFRDEETDINVIEVGLGGKLDGTNVINSRYQVLTNIGLEHTEILGDTKELILKDKQEIIKDESFVVTGIQEKELLDILKKKVRSTKSTLFCLAQDFSLESSDTSTISNHRFDFHFPGNTFNVKNISLTLPGLFQIENAALASAITSLMINEFPDVTSESIRQGLMRAYIPGRFQVLSNTPLIIIDGAHIPDKIQKLVDSLNYYYPKKKFITIFRFKKRKDINQSLQALTRIAHTMLITGSRRPSDMGTPERFTDTDISTAYAQGNFEVIYKPSEAMERAKQLQKEHPDCGILATGSLFMISDLLQNAG